jgi:hypothetical protein
MRPGGRTVGVLLAVGVMLATAGSARGLVWSVQPTPFPGLGVGAVSCVSARACTAVGAVETPAGTTEGTGAMGVDGRRWRRQSTPDPDPAAEDLRDFDDLSGVSCTSSKVCVAVGEYAAGFEYDPSGVHNYPMNMPLAERWNGVGWSLLPFPSLPTGAESGELDAISCMPGPACMAVGRFDGPGLAAERWDGSSWSTQSMPVPTVPPVSSTLSWVRGLSCLSSRFCIAVGYGGQENILSGEDQTFAERWDGSSWSVQTTPRGAGEFEFYGVSCTSPSACTAVGSYSRGPSLPARTLAERWNGTSWSVQRTPNGSGSDNYLSGISCASSRECVAVGDSGPQLLEAPLVERWDGTRWSIERTPDVGNGGLGAVSCTSRIICTAVGSDLGGALVEQSAPASARLTGTPARCASDRFTLHLRGIEISSVVWSLDGKRVSGHRVDRGTLYVVSFRLSPGRHKLNVKVTFEPSSETHAATVRRTVVGCASAP